MIELPESVNRAKQLAETVSGKRIAFVEAAQSPHGFAFYTFEPAMYPSMLEGKAVGECVSSGGIVEMIIEDMHLAFNDGVNIRYYPNDEKLPKKHQLHLRFDDGSCIICTIQMYGGMMIYPLGDSDNFYYNVTKQKPSPLTPDFDEAYFRSLLDDCEDKLSVKAFLATEQRIPGLGNGVLQDILWNARINPKRKLRDFEAGQPESLYTSVKETLATMAEQGGRDTEKDLFGEAGGYRTVLSAKTKGEPCRRCGSEIERKAFLGGNVYFCPTCQPHRGAC